MFSTSKGPLCTQTKSNLNFCVNFFLQKFRIEQKKKKLLNVNFSVSVSNSTELCDDQTVESEICFAMKIGFKSKMHFAANKETLSNIT